MKRFIVILICLLALVSAVSGLHSNFQNFGDTTDYTCISYDFGGTCVWTESATGGNNFMSANPNRIGTSYIVNKNAQATTYVAATFVSGSARPKIILYDSSYGILYTYPGDYSAYGRYEMKMIGGQANIYKNGTLLATSAALAINPSYVGLGGQDEFTVPSSYANWDDIVYGTTESPYVIGMPETNLGGASYYILKKSIIDPANSGLANGATYVVVSPNNMTTTFSKNNADAEVMYLKHTGTGEIVGIENVSGYTGTVVWPLQEDVFAKIITQAPYGSYVAYLSGSPTTLSTPIQYISSGATILFNADIYSTGDIATYSWNIQPDYWALRSAGYSFSAKIYDVYGQQRGNHPISGQNGFSTLTFIPSDPEGVYYVALVATDSAGNDAWVAYDYATLTGYLTFIGYVNDAQTARNLTVANVSITQGSTVFNTVTNNGNYTTAGTAFGAGQAITFNITAPGYQRYNFTFTPIATKTVNPMNFTLMPLVKTASGVAADGIVFDDVYARPLPDDLVTYTNVSHSTVHSATTNNAGYYLIDALHGGPLVSGYCYLVNSSLSRYTQVAPSGMKCVV